MKLLPTFHTLKIEYFRYLDQIWHWGLNLKVTLIPVFTKWIINGTLNMLMGFYPTEFKGCVDNAFTHSVLPDSGKYLVLVISQIQ